MKPVCMFLALSAAASPSFACPHFPESQQIARGAAEEVEALNIVERHLTESDDVFVGRLLDLDRQSSMVEENGGKHELAVFKVRLDPIRIIKGTPTADTIYTFERRENIYYSGCSSLVGEENISFDEGIGYRFIVYAKAGRVLRVNSVVDWFDGLSSRVELEMIEQALGE